MDARLQYRNDLERIGFTVSVGVALLFLLLLGLTSELYVIIGVAGAAVLVASGNPKIRTLIIITLVPLAHAGVGLPGLKGFGLFDMFGAFYILLFIWSVGIVRSRELPVVPVFPLAFVMAVGFIPSIVNSASMLETIKAFAQLLFSILLGISFYASIRREGEGFRRLLLVLFVIVATLASLYGLYEASRSSILRVMSGRAFFTLFGDVNYYASFLLMAEAIALGFLLIVRKIQYRLFFALSATTLAIAIVSTVSRSALAVLILVWLSYLVYVFFFERGARKYVGPVVALGILGLVGTLLLTDVGSKMVDLFTLTRRVESVVGGKDASVDQRFTILGIGWEIVQENPLIGVGFGSFEKTFDHYQDGKLSTGFGRSAHNTYLRILAETGIVGFLASLVFFIAIVRFLWNGFVRATGKEEKTILFALCVSVGSFLVMSATLDQLFEPHFWIMLAIGFLYAERTVGQTNEESEGTVVHA